MTQQLRFLTEATNGSLINTASTTSLPHQLLVTSIPKCLYVQVGK